MIIAEAILLEHIPEYAIVKRVRFLGDSRDRISDFPDEARREAGVQLYLVQTGRQPDDFKPMTTVGLGVEEIRIRDKTGAYRVFYIARFDEAVYVLHAFEKKSQKTAKKDIEQGQKRYRDLMKWRSHNGNA